MLPLQICIGPTIRIGRESWCLPYAGFFGGGPKPRVLTISGKKEEKNLFFENCVIPDQY